MNLVYGRLLDKNFLIEFDMLEPLIFFYFMVSRSNSNFHEIFYRKKSQNDKERDKILLWSWNECFKKKKVQGKTKF